MAVKARGPCRRVEAVGRSVWQRVVVPPLTYASHHRPTLVHLSRFRLSDPHPQPFQAFL
jgi:hypothetical protein